MESIKNRKNRKAWIAVLLLSLTMIMLGFGLTDSYGVTPEEVADGKVYNQTQSITYDTIQAAIDAASPGDTLVAGEGTYNESVVVDVENLTLKAYGDTGETIIDGGTYPVEVQVDQFTLEGFTILDVDDSGSVGAISIQEVEDGVINISDCVFENATNGILFDTVTDSTVMLSGNQMTTGRGICFEQAVTGSTITVTENTVNTLTDISDDAGVFFVKAITDCLVDITDNSFTDCEYGVLVYTDIIDTEMNITGNDVTGGDYGVFTYFENLDQGICGTSVLTVEENTFSNLNYDGIFVYNIEQGGEANIKNNIISDGDYGIYVEYVSYFSPEASANLYIEGNDITDCYNGIQVSDVSNGSAIIEANNIHNACIGIYMDYTGHASTMTDVQIIDNCITADADNSGLYDAIFVSYAEAATTISGNEISGYNSTDQYENGISLFIGWYGADPAVVEVTDNRIQFVDNGIFMDDIAYKVDAEVLFAGNEISDAEYGLYLEDMASDAADVDVIGNTFRNCDYGLYVYYMYGETDYEKYLTISWNVITGNDVGIHLDYVTLDQEDPGVWIVSNDITNNGTGLNFGHTPSADADQIIVGFNNFSGNTAYAVNMLGEGNEAIASAKAPAKAPSPESFTLQAQLNWWGDPTGPEYNDNGAKGDEINGLVNFDPWIQKLVITPKNSTGFEGKTRSFTATLYDSNGDIADAPLAVRFTVTGANKAMGTVELVNGVATFQYTGNNLGTDSVDAGLVFVEEPVEGLTETAAANWTAATDDPGTNPAEEDNSPDTGDYDNLWYLYTLVMSLLLGLGFVRFHLATTMKK